MAENESQSQTNVKGGGKKLVIGICAVSLVAVAGIGAFFLTRPKEEPEEMRKVISADTAEEVAEEIFNSEPSEIPDSYTVTQNALWTFKDGKSATEDAYVENDKENETPVYFDLVVDETGETIYSSPVLELGAVLENFKLDKEVEKGEYDCTVVYHLIDGEQNTLTTTSVGVTVEVLN